MTNVKAARHGRMVYFRCPYCKEIHHYHEKYANSEVKAHCNLGMVFIKVMEWLLVG